MGIPICWQWDKGLDEIDKINMQESPLVSVVCLCYNHEKFVRQALQSVFDQTYPNIELVVVDDASTDNSRRVIEATIQGHECRAHFLQENLGNTRAFNFALQHCKGQYIVDLAADDLFTEDRIEKQVNFFQIQSDHIGVIYSDAHYIDEKGAVLGGHFTNPQYRPHTGDVYKYLIAEYFIPPPTMMMKKEVLDELGGYDGNLAYEDFDFWVRSSRNWHYGYQPEVLTLIRKTKGSLSTKAYNKKDRQLHSTYLVCRKVKAMNDKAEENEALIKRLAYEIRQSVFSGNFEEATLFIDLYREIVPLPIGLYFLKGLNTLKIDLSIFRYFYHKIYRRATW
ncbi:MAG: glycosyltransferase [Cyclobacteriaceae bacterium]